MCFMSQSELRWRLKNVYDRHEVHDVLQHLQSAGNLKRTRGCESSTEPSSIVDVGPADNAEEKMTFWFPGETRWFSV